MVRYTKEHKQETRQRIIATAGRRLKRDGIEGRHHDVVIDRVEEHSRAWIVYCATERYRRTRNPLNLIVGSSPIVVVKATGEALNYGSAPSEYAEFRAISSLAAPTPVTSSL